MDAYLLRHYQATGATGGKGFVAFIPVVITRNASPAEDPVAENSANPKDGEEDTTQP